MNKAALLWVASMAAAQTPDAVFHSGTRLVEVDVVVRAHRVRPPGAREWMKWVFDSGPPFGPPGEPLEGLSKEDFTLLDNGQPQRIAVFHEGAGEQEPPFPIPPGAVSNRTSQGGRSEPGATAVLIDLLNTQWELTEYARLGANQLARSPIGTGSRVAVYTLGKTLHVLRDFNDDPHQPIEMAEALRDYGDPPTAFVDFRERARETTAALGGIIRHLAGVPGRKSLVWMSGGFAPPPAVVAMMRQANIVLYPVVVRGTAVPDNGTASGGRRFFDALDLSSAVETASQDSSVAYVLGYYPSEKMLDGKYHSIAVQLHDSKVRADAAEIHYRSGYAATRTEARPPARSLAQVVGDPLDATGIGLAALAAPSAPDAAAFDVRVTVDLHDIHLDRAGSRFRGVLEYAVPSSGNTFRAGSVALNLTEPELVRGLQRGFTLLLTGVEPESGQIRVAVRDRATGVAGAVRVAVAQPAVAKQ